MATEWVDVADNAVKIGLGSLLTILGGWLTLKLTQKHELKKEAAVQGLKDKGNKNQTICGISGLVSISHAKIFI